MEWGMIRVAAKRVSAGIALSPDNIDAPNQPTELIEVAPLDPLPRFVDCPAPLPTIGPEHPDAHGAWLAYAAELASAIEPGAHRYQSDRRVAAVLVSRDGKLLGSARNSNARNRTRHAEVNLTQAWCAAERASLPEGARVYTTLKSCKMCAGMLWQAAANPASMRVYFAEPDPGPMGRATVFNPGTFEWQRAGAPASIESHWPPTC
jgi:tRNA(Arg) A34 adenosine deaminase TadA